MNIQPRLLRFLTCLGIAVCLAGLLAAHTARADEEDDSNIKADIVVDMTDAGRAVAHPTRKHPAYYYPSVRGYTQGGAILGNQGEPPPSFAILHSIAEELAHQGYLVASKATPAPSLVLMFWWGYKAPIFLGPSGSQIQGSVIGGHGGANLNQLALNSQLPTAVMANHTEMEELVFGANFGHDNIQNLPNLRMQRLNTASREARYFLIVSALDYNAAIQKKRVLLWTARVSTEIGTQTLQQILPTLIADGVPMFGRETKGPEWRESPLVPLGHVELGIPVLKSSSTPAVTVAPAPGK